MTSSVESTSSVSPPLFTRELEGHSLEKLLSTCSLQRTGRGAKKQTGGGSRQASGGTAVSHIHEIYEIYEIYHHTVSTIATKDTRPRAVHVITYLALQWREKKTAAANNVIAITVPLGDGWHEDAMSINKTTPTHAH